MKQKYNSAKSSIDWCGGFAPILILVVVVALGLMGLYAYKYGQLTSKVVNPSPNAGQTPTDDMANWKTYANSQYDFSFKYPPDWKLDEEKNKNNLNLTIESNIKSFYNDSPLEGKPYFLNYKIYINDLNSDYVNKLEFPDKKIIQFNNFIGFRTTNYPCGFYTCLTTMTNLKQSEYLEITLSPYSSDEEYSSQTKVVDYYDQILSTFKFLDSLSEESAISLVKQQFPEVSSINKSGSNVGTTSDISTKLENSIWKLEFRRGSGDCPSGCINNQYWYFTVDKNSKVTKMGEYKRIYDSSTNSYQETGVPIWDFAR